jgi:hypothetical protein
LRASVTMRSFAAAALALFCLAAGSCGLMGGEDKGGVHVAWMEFTPGYGPEDVDTLAWSAFDVGGPYRLTSDVNPVLMVDDDLDRPYRVMMHEGLVWLYMDTYGPAAFANGNRPEAPPGYDRETWYLSSGDTLPPLWPITPAEAAWAAFMDPIKVYVDGNGPLREWVTEAARRINEAAGVDVLLVQGGS